MAITVLKRLQWKDTGVHNKTGRWLSYKVYFGIRGKRERVNQIAACNYLDEVAELDWVKEMRYPFGYDIAEEKPEQLEIEVLHEALQVSNMPVPTCSTDGWDVNEWSKETSKKIDYFKFFSDDSIIKYSAKPTSSMTSTPIPYDEYVKVASFTTLESNNGEIYVNIDENDQYYIGFIQDFAYYPVHNIYGLKVDGTVEFISVTGNIRWTAEPNSHVQYYQYTGGNKVGPYAASDVNLVYILPTGAGSNRIYNVNSIYHMNWYTFASYDEMMNYFATGDYTGALNYRSPYIADDFMDLNKAGNSVMPNAKFTFVNPAPGITYQTEQRVDILMRASGATENPYMFKRLRFIIPPNARVFFVFDGKSLVMRSNTAGITIAWAVYNVNESTILGSNSTVLTFPDYEIPNIYDFGSFKGPQGNFLWDVQITTPFIFLRQIYNCARKEELPQKGTPSYEIFQEGTSSIYVNPNGTGEKAAAHLLTFTDIGNMKAAADAGTLNEFDFYYRARYGAEFPWPDSPTPGPKPGEAVIAGTLIHAGWQGSGWHNLQPSDDSRVFDTVTYNFVIPGQEYTVIGMMYDRTDGVLLDESYSELTFVPENTYGDVYVEMHFNSEELGGHEVVAFVSLYQNGELLSSLEDEYDEDETIYILAPSEGDEYEPDDDEEAPYFCAVDENFNALGIIDNYESLIWTDRFDKAGDFELYTTVDESLFNLLKVDTYFYIPQSDKHMIVEKIEISTDVDGDKLQVTGRSLEAILDRRVVWKRTNVNGNLQQGLKKIFEDNIINPPVGERRIANFVFKESNDPRITSLTLEAEYFGDNIYELVCDVCQTNHIGFRIRLNANNQFVFELYPGVDRSYDNPDNNLYLIFSPENDNVGNNNYLENKENYKNVALVGTSSDDTTSSYGNKDYTGLSRRETYISATDIDKDVLTKDQYKQALSDKGKVALKDYQNIKTIDGTMVTRNYTYLKDFGLGDIIEAKDGYGHESKSRITEIIINHDSSGFTIYPTFESKEED